jgi:hypothetical protein
VNAHSPIKSQRYSAVSRERIHGDDPVVSEAQPLQIAALRAVVDDTANHGNHNPTQPAIAIRKR